MDQTDYKLKEISDAKLQKLSENPNNIVYKYEEKPRLKESEIIPLPKVEKFIRELWAETTMVYNTKLQGVRNRLNMKKVRWWLLKKSPHKAQWILFSETHPLIFDRVTDMEMTPKEIQALQYMIFLKSKGHRREELQKYLWSNFSMSEAEYRKKYGEDIKVVK